MGCLCVSNDDGDKPIKKVVVEKNMPAELAVFAE